MRNLFDINGPVIRTITLIFDLFLLGALWLIFSLPLLTMGAASSAVYAVVYRYIRRENGYLWRTFWDSYKDNVLHRIPAWIAALLVLFVLTIDVLVFRTRLITGQSFGAVYYITLLLFLIACIWIVYLTAYMAMFNGTVTECLRLSFMMVYLHPISAAYVGGVLLVGALIFTSIPGLLLLFPGTIAWAASYTLEKVFTQHMSADDVERLTGMGEVVEDEMDSPHLS